MHLHSENTPIDSGCSLNTNTQGASLATIGNQKVSNQSKPVIIPISSRNKPPSLSLISGFIGKVHVNSLADLIQFFSLSSATILLKITSSKKTNGLIWFNNGIVIHSECEKLEGVDSFYEILKWRFGEFSMENYTDIPKKTINLSVAVLLLKAFHRMDQDQILSSRKKEIESNSYEEENKEVNQEQENIEESLAETDSKELGFFFETAMRQILENIENPNLILVRVSNSTILNVGPNTSIELAKKLTESCVEIVRSYREIELITQDKLKEIVISLTTQFSVIRATKNPDVFLYLKIERGKTTLGQARFLLKEAEHRLYEDKNADFI